MMHGRSVKIVTTRNIDKSSVDGRIISLIHMNFILKWSTCVHLCPPVDDPKKAMSFDSTRKSVEPQSSGVEFATGAPTSCGATHLKRRSVKPEEENSTHGAWTAWSTKFSSRVSLHCDFGGSSTWTLTTVPQCCRNFHVIPIL